MSRTRNDVEELWGAVDEIEYLWDQEQQEGFAKMGQDRDAGERHAGDVAVGIAYKDAGWVAVVDVEGYGDGKEGEEDVESQEVGVGRRVLSAGVGAVENGVARERDEIETGVEYQQAGDHQ